MLDQDIPKELLNIILEYDGRIKFKKGYYINIIHKHDLRYNIIDQVILKKKEIIKHICINGLTFYFEFRLNKNIGLCYDYGWSFSDKPNQFEICFYNFKDGWEQIRTYI